MQRCDVREATARTPFRNIVAFVTQGVSSFGLSVVGNVFNDWTHLGLPSFDSVRITSDPGPDNREW
ncbi:hypothetical protein GCM10010404_54520 [Nonomuraea africana]|uniref:Uncharacterized protein n=1 Tax=Nonomuraea africana TaxID=46171 RepID=A0ABR9K5T9_9ACTN|nr:hypothetical protein [Nonomuraea africana]